MSPNRVARIAAIILALAGLASMVAGGLVATRQFRVSVVAKNGQGTIHPKCGSVLFPKDPRNKVGNQAIPKRLQNAYSKCQKASSNRTHTATTFLLVGLVPLLIVLMLPALSRRSRRSRAHRRQKF